MQNRGPDPFSEAVTKGAELLGLGVADLSKWSRTMVYWFGEEIRPQLERIWTSAQAKWQAKGVPPAGPPVDKGEQSPGGPPPSRQSDRDFKVCPYCKEQIRATAIKCRFCSEWLELPVESETPKNLDGSSGQVNSPGEEALLSPSREMNSTAQTPHSPANVPIASTRYRVEYKGQTWEASEIQGHSAEEAAKSYLARDSQRRHEDYAEIIVSWGKFGRERQSFKTEDLLPFVGREVKPRSTAEIQIAVRIPTVGVVWLRIWNYVIIPYCALVLSRYVVVVAINIIRRISDQPGLLVESSSFLGVVVGSSLAVVGILGLAALLTAVAVGLHKRRAWAWKANWIGFGFISILILLRPNPFSIERQQAGISILSLAVTILWVVLNTEYFLHRRQLFQPRGERNPC